RPALGDVLVLADQPRDGRRQADAVQSVEVEEVVEQRAELVARALRLRREAPARAELRAVEEPEDRLRVADVDREQHLAETLARRRLRADGSRRCDRRASPA